MAVRELYNTSHRTFLMLGRRKYFLPFQRELSSRVNFPLLLRSTNLNYCSAKREVLYQSSCKLLNASLSTKGESADYDVDAVDKSSKVVSSRVESLRVDLVLKVGLGLSRSKIEKAFYQSRIRVNGKKIFKKGQLIHEGDEIDLIRGVSPMNPDFLTIARVEVLDTSDEGDDYSIKLRRTKNLVVENYKEPWDETNDIK